MASSTINYSLWTIPAAWATCHVNSAIAFQLAPFKWDNRMPRAMHSILSKDVEMSQERKDFLFRLKSAEANGHEQLGMFCAIVVLGNVARLDLDVLNWYSWGFVLVRVVYNIAYWKSSTYQWARVRSGIFNVGLYFLWMLWWKSMRAFLVRDEVLRMMKSA